ncbi:hypothetical protein EIP86_006573 [Pleurotus ostreatoroseus]|nr:hypothetical protein EIP86_006573 [Pleurotus ostreatoroseus]
MRETVSDLDLRKPLTPSNGPGLYQVLTGLFTTPHTIHSLLGFFVVDPRYLLIPTDIPYHDRSFPDLVSKVNCSKEENISILSSCYSFFSWLTKEPYAVRAGWHRMFAAAVTCFKDEKLSAHDPHAISCLETHTEACNDDPPLASAHVHVVDVHTVSSIDAGDPRSHGARVLPDRSNTSTPRSEAVDRVLEREVVNAELVRVPHADEDAQGRLDTAPIRTMTAEEEATAGSSVTTSALLPPLLDREVDPSTTGDAPVAERALNLLQGQAGVFVQSLERGEDTGMGAVDEIRAASLLAPYGRVDAAGDTGEQDNGA